MQKLGEAGKEIGPREGGSMKGRPWLWIIVAALGIASVCCAGVLVGAVLGQQGTAEAQRTTVAAAEPVRNNEREGSEAQPPAPTAVAAGPTAPLPPPAATPTVVPMPPTPPAPPPPPPGDSDLQALIAYANAMQPLLEEGGELVERDAAILKAAEGGNDVVLCDGRLAADRGQMADVLRRVRAVAPPADAAAIQVGALSGGDAWLEALDNIGLFCETGKQLYKVPAVLKVWEAAATIQDAANRFWLLLIAEGIEDWVQR